MKSKTGAENGKGKVNFSPNRTGREEKSGKNPAKKRGEKIIKIFKEINI